jgi:hypothetical protein
MRTTPFAFVLLIALIAACSNEEPSSTLLVQDAMAAPVQPANDYGWRTTPNYPAKQDEVRDYE